MYGTLAGYVVPEAFIGCVLQLQLCYSYECLTGHPNPRPRALCKVLLLMWTSNIDLGMQVEMLELFSGDAKVSQVFREAGKRTVSYDMLYDPKGKCMDFLSPGGFA